MIDIDLIRNEDTRENVIHALAKRGVVREDIDEVLSLDTTWRSMSAQIQELRAQKNAANADISAAEGDAKQSLIAAMQRISTEEKALSEQIESIEQRRTALWKSLPNIPLEDVPEGGEEDFLVVSSHPEDIPAPSFTQKSYMELLGKYIDLERAAKVSGSRFAYITGPLAQLEMALVSYLFNELSKRSFVPVIPPVLVKEDAMAGMGYLDHEGDEIYKTQDDLYLAGTSEQAIGPMHAHEILNIADLPKRYVAFSSCFRREAGSHGKDVQGILRLHQFEKVEMFSITSPDTSQEEHEFLLETQKHIMDTLELPYRVIQLAAGDLGAPSAKTYDIETWIPSQNTYRETHSTSNTTDFQARRLGIRMRDMEGNIHKAHMLNGTAVAMSRILIALIENHQQEDESVRIPEALYPYLSFTSL